MRRLSVSWVLSLLLVFAQSGAVLHELGHLQPHGGTSLRADPLSESATCPTCESFAQVTNPASGGSPALTVAQAAIVPAPAPSHAILDAEALTPRSRGPPQV
jgi:hypothetical protein